MKSILPIIGVLRPRHSIYIRIVSSWLLFNFGVIDSFLTLAKTEIIYPKNVRAKVAMDSTCDKYSSPRTIEKNESPVSHFGATS